MILKINIYSIALPTMCISSASTAKLSIGPIWNCNDSSTG